MPRGFKNLNKKTQQTQQTQQTTKKKRNENKRAKRKTVGKQIIYYDNDELLQWIICDSYVKENERKKLYKENEDIISYYENNIDYYTNLIQDLPYINNPEYYDDLKTEQNIKNMVLEYKKIKNDMKIELNKLLNTIENDIQGTQIILNDECIVQQLELFEIISQNF